MPSEGASRYGDSGKLDAHPIQSSLSAEVCQGQDETLVSQHPLLSFVVGGVIVILQNCIE